MSFSVLHASIAGMSQTDYWKSSFVDGIGDCKCVWNANVSMEVDGLYVFEVKIH